MNYLDLILLIILCSGAIWGFRKGLIKAVLGFLAIGLAIWAGIKFSGLLEIFLSDLELIPVEFIHIASLIVTILLVYLAINVVAKILHGITHTIGLGIFNRLGGAIFGLLLNVLMLSTLIYYILPFFSHFDESQTISQSKILPYLNEIITLVKSNFHLFSDSLNQIN